MITTGKTKNISPINYQKHTCTHAHTHIHIPYIQKTTQMERKIRRQKRKERRNKTVLRKHVRISKVKLVTCKR
jgi:hypothetical protein